jgi:hypothetical protein
LAVSQERLALQSLRFVHTSISLPYTIYGFYKILDALALPAKYHHCHLCILQFMQATSHGCIPFYLHVVEISFLHHINISMILCILFPPKLRNPALCILNLKFSCKLCLPVLISGFPGLYLKNCLQHPYQILKITEAYSVHLPKNLWNYLCTFSFCVPPLAIHI